MRAKFSSWETSLDASTHLILTRSGVTARYRLLARRYGQCFCKKEHWPHPRVIHQVSLPAGHNHVVALWPSKRRGCSWVTQRGWETFASLPSDQTPPWDERQLSGSGWLGTSIRVLICFFLQPEQSRILPLLSKGTGCVGAQSRAACVKCWWKRLGRLCSHSSQHFAHHLEQCYRFCSMLLPSSWANTQFF